MKKLTIVRLPALLAALLSLSFTTAATITYDTADGSGVPEQVTAGYTELSVSTGEEATVTLIRLHDDTGRDEFEGAIADVNAGMMGQGDVAAAMNSMLEIADLVLEVPATPDGVTTVGAVLEEGAYVIEYLPMSDDGPLGTPTYTYFQASGAGDPAPEPDAHVSLVDFNFTIPSDLTAGSQVWEVANDGDQIHHMVLFQLNEGATIEDFMAFMESEEGPPPGREAGYVGVFGPGQTVYQTFDFEEGTYVAICFIPDHVEGGTGAPHFTHGMISTFEVGN